MIDQIIENLQLQPHPEGGYYRETYRSKDVISSECLNGNFDGDRNTSTCIYYMLTGENFSAFHKINQDEIWHFYKGQTVMIHILTNNGEYSKIEMGDSILENEIPQFVVPKDVWFAAELKFKRDYCLVGCTVSPGFDFKDFQLAKRHELINSFPQHQKIITALTRE